MQLDPQSFVVDIGLNDGCLIAIQSNSDESFVLGEPFFRNFLSVFDDENNMFGIVPRKLITGDESYNSKVTQGLVPNSKLIVEPKINPAKANNTTVPAEKMPSISDPVGLIKYFIRRAYLFFAGSSSQKQGGQEQISMTTILELAGAAIGVMVLCCCCCCVALYGFF